MTTNTVTVFLSSLQQNLSINDKYPYTSYPFTPLVASPYPTPAPPAFRADAKLFLPLILPSAFSFGLAATAIQDGPNSPTSSVSSHSRTASDGDLASQCPHGVRVFLAQSYNDKVEALRLLAQSVTEQRILALRALITHPLHILIALTLLFSVRTWFGATIVTRFGTYSTLYSCLTMLAALAAVALFAVSIPYSRLAEVIGWDWLGQDEIIVAWRDTDHGGDDLNDHDDISKGEIVGVAVLAWRANEGRVGRKGRRVGRAWVRGWGVNKMYTNYGIGRSLLDEAVRIVNCRGGDGVFFDEHHAHSALVLPPFYAGAFLRRDLKAQETLAFAWNNRSTNSRRRNSNR